MRPLLLIAAAASAGLVARYVAKEASRLPKGLPLGPSRVLDERAIGANPASGSPNEAERLNARGLGDVPLPTAATPDEQGSIPGLPDFTRGA